MSFAPVSRSFIYPPPLYPKSTLVQIKKMAIPQNLQRPVQLVKIVNYDQNKNTVINASEKNGASKNLFNNSFHEKKKESHNQIFEKLQRRERSLNNSFYKNEQIDNNLNSLTDFHQMREILNSSSHEKNQKNPINDRLYVSSYEKHLMNEQYMNSNQKKNQACFTTGFNQNDQKSFNLNEKFQKTENSLDRIYENVLSRTNKILEQNKDLINSYLKEKTNDENIWARRRARSFIECDFQRTGLKEIQNHYNYQSNKNDNYNPKLEKNSEYKKEIGGKSRFYSDQKTEDKDEEIQANTKEFKIIEKNEKVPIIKENPDLPTKSQIEVEIKKPSYSQQNTISNKRKEETHNNISIQIEDKENRIDLKEQPTEIAENLMSKLESCSRRAKEILDSKTRINAKRLSFDATKMSKFMTENPIFESDHESENGSPVRNQNKLLEINDPNQKFSKILEHSNVAPRLNSFKNFEDNLEKEKNLNEEEDSADADKKKIDQKITADSSKPLNIVVDVDINCEKSFIVHEELEEENNNNWIEENSQKEEEDVEERENEGDSKILEERRKLLYDFERCREKSKMLLDD